MGDVVTLPPDDPIRWSSDVLITYLQTNANEVMAAELIDKFRAEKIDGDMFMVFLSDDRMKELQFSMRARHLLTRQRRLLQRKSKEFQRMLKEDFDLLVDSVQLEAEFGRKRENASALEVQGPSKRRKHAADEHIENYNAQDDDIQMDDTPLAIQCPTPILRGENLNYEQNPPTALALPRRIAPVRMNREKGYYPQKAFSVHQYFYNGDELLPDEDEVGDWVMINLKIPTGSRRAAERAMRRFFTRTRDLEDGRVHKDQGKDHYTVQYYDHLEYPYTPAATIYEIDGAANIGRVYQRPRGIQSREEEAMLAQPLLNLNDNSNHEWDYLAEKWSNMPDDGILPAYGDSDDGYDSDEIRAIEAENNAPPRPTRPPRRLSMSRYSPPAYLPTQSGAGSGADSGSGSRIAQRQDIVDLTQDDDIEELRESEDDDIFDDEPELEVDPHTLLIDYVRSEDEASGHRPKSKGKAKAVSRAYRSTDTQKNHMKILEERRRQFNMEDGDRSQSSDVSGDSFAVNCPTETEKAIRLHPRFAQAVKPHQLNGIRFMWEQVVWMTQKGSPGGALLAHTMGTGKTLQVIAFLHTLATAGASEDPGIQGQIPENLRKSSTLILAPISVLDNWMAEFYNWLPLDANGQLSEIMGPLIKIDNDSKQRSKNIREWGEEGGVLLMGYERFRGYMDENCDEPDIADILINNPAVVVADEAHTLKNESSKVSLAASRIKTTARLALTGSPMSNNIMEYYVMLQFVHEGFLGNMRQFKDAFATPIEEGLDPDATGAQKRTMKRKLLALWKHTAPKINRVDSATLGTDLPPKREYVLTIQMTALQQELYNMTVSCGKRGTGGGFLDMVHLLGMVCLHPSVFKQTLEHRISTGHLVTKEFSKEVYDNTMEILRNYPDYDKPEYSEKMKCIQRILESCQLLDEGVLIFTQSLESLSYLGQLLRKWRMDFQILQGSTPGNQRQVDVERFNKQQGFRVYLISTRSGGLGINLQSVARVILMDYGFNPMWEEQAVGRSYRIGQTKQVFVYKFLAGKTYEDTLLNRINLKTNLTKHVVDKIAYNQTSARATTKISLKPCDGDYSDFPRMVDDFKGQDAILDAIIAHNMGVYDIFAIETLPFDAEEIPETEYIEEIQLLKQSMPDASRQWMSTQSSRSSLQTTRVTTQTSAIGKTTTTSTITAVKSKNNSSRTIGSNAIASGSGVNNVALTNAIKGFKSAIINGLTNRVSTTVGRIGTSRVLPFEIDEDDSPPQAPSTPTPRFSTGRNTGSAAKATPTASNATPSSSGTLPRPRIPFAIDDSPESEERA